MVYLTNLLISKHDIIKICTYRKQLWHIYIYIYVDTHTHIYKPNLIDEDVSIFFIRNVRLEKDDLSQDYALVRYP